MTFYEHKSTQAMGRKMKRFDSGDLNSQEVIINIMAEDISSGIKNAVFLKLIPACSDRYVNFVCCFILDAGMGFCLFEKVRIKEKEKKEVTVTFIVLSLSSRRISMYN